MAKYKQVGFKYGKISGEIYNLETGRVFLKMNLKNWRDKIEIEKLGTDICEYLNRKYYVHA